MAKNVLVSLFEVESEAYQALTELKNAPAAEGSFLTSAVLVKKEGDAYRLLDGFDTGVNTMDDTMVGGVVGGLIGILGGPIGVLLGASYGALIGTVVDSGDTVIGASLIEQIALKMENDDIAIIGMADETDETVLDNKLSKFKAMIIRYDAAAVEEEVAQAELLAVEMARQARQELRAQKKAERKEKRAEKKAEFEDKKAEHAERRAEREAEFDAHMKDMAEEYIEKGVIV